MPLIGIHLQCARCHRRQFLEADSGEALLATINREGWREIARGAGPPDSVCGKCAPQFSGRVYAWGSIKLEQP